MQAVEKFALTLKNTLARDTLYAPLRNPRNNGTTNDAQQICCPYHKFSIQR